MPALAPALDIDTADRLRTALGRISRRLRTTAAAQEAGLTPTAISVLLSVDRTGPLKLSDLAGSEAINPTMLSRAIAGMVEDRLLERSSDPHDRRVAWVSITPAGRRLAQRIRRERTAAVNRALAVLPEADRRRIEVALPGLEGLAEELKGRQR